VHDGGGLLVGGQHLVRFLALPCGTHVLDEELYFYVIWKDDDEMLLPLHYI
jgi:hypothetical protein